MAGEKWYCYDPGGDPKHKPGTGPEPDFRREGSELVGKCPNGLSESTVLRLLNEGIPYPEEWEEADGPPARLYNVHRGIPFVARRNAPGSYYYHGHPLGYRQVTSGIRRELEARARAQGYEREFRRWCKQHKVE